MAHENVTGLIAVFAMIRAQDGIWGTISHRFDLALFRCAVG